MRTIKAQIRAFLANGAGIEDPLAGVISERAYLYSGDETGRVFGAAPDGCIKVRGDGYTTAHVGACSAAIEEAPEEALIRLAGLDRVDAEIVRRRARYETTESIALGMVMSVRTVQRRIVAIRVKAEGAAKVLRGGG
jgi:hypothetical protein